MLPLVPGMLKRETLAISDIYVPVKRRETLEQTRVDEIAASMLDQGQKTSFRLVKIWAWREPDKGAED